MAQPWPILSIVTRRFTCDKREKEGVSLLSSASCLGLVPVLMALIRGRFQVRHNAVSLHGDHAAVQDVYSLFCHGRHALRWFMGVPTENWVGFAPVLSIFESEFIFVQQRSLGVFRRHNLRLCNLPSSYDTPDFVASRSRTAFSSESSALFDLQCSRCLKHSAIANDRLRDCPAAAVRSFNWQIERQRSVQMPCVELAVSFCSTFALLSSFAICD